MSGQVSFSAGYLKALEESGYTTDDARRARTAFDGVMRDEPTFEVQIEGGVGELLAALKAHGKPFQLRGHTDANWD